MHHLTGQCLQSIKRNHQLQIGWEYVSKQIHTYADGNKNDTTASTQYLHVSPRSFRPGSPRQLSSLRFCWRHFSSNDTPYLRQILTKKKYLFEVVCVSRTRLSWWRRSRRDSGKIQQHRQHTCSAAPARLHGYGLRRCLYTHTKYTHEG